MEQTKSDVKPGMLVGAWKLTTQLGHGGQGEVWAVKPARTRRAPQRALKISFAQDEQARHRFAREVELLQRCDSPHVLKVYDFGLDWQSYVPQLPPFAYYVSEKCQGSLAQRKETLGDARRRLELFRHACLAVQHLHSLPNPIIHRDIKPDNFLIAQELSNVVLADFGVARAESAVSLTEAFEVVGTQYYRAPEVLHGGRGSFQSDVYCLGRLLEWLLTGDVSTDMGTRPVPRAGDLSDDACDVLDRLIVKATQMRPTDRFISVQDLAESIPELWLAVRPRPKLRSIPAGSDAPAVLATALELARTNDMLSWRQLEQALRREQSQALPRWRSVYEPNWRDGNKDLGVQATNAIIDAGSGRLMLGLGGVFSGHPGLADQRRMIDDWVFPPGWNAGGATAIIEGPRTLLFVAHYLHGAVCLGSGNHELAVQFASTAVRRTQLSGNEALWKHQDLVGWPKLLGGNCAWAWEYLRSLWDTRPTLQSFFALQSDYEIALASYSMILSLLELAEDSGRLTSATLTDPNIGLEVPPFFVSLSYETIALAARRTTANRSIVEWIAARVGADLPTMQTLWPHWNKLQLSWRRRVFNLWGQDLPLGDLATAR